MGLEQSIIIKNRFTVVDATGRGSRGSTPGAYVERYMGRDEATEALLPVQRDGISAYVERYMAREGAVEAASPLAEARRRVSKPSARDGIAFSDTSVSLVNDELKELSARLQSIFDAGQPVLECVLSFDTDYLRENGLVDPALPEGGRGYLKGHVDQLRLREAVREGMRSLSHTFSSLVWIGVLQFDTTHVHAHLALAEGDVERTPRLLRSDGTYKATLSKDERRLIRNGIDRSLDLTAALPHLTASISNQRTNVRSFVQRYAVHELMESGDVQLVMAVLPSDASLWRASSNRREMARANELTRDLVHRAFDRPDSGYAQVERLVHEYAERRSAREGAGADRRRELVRNGLARVENECVNGVYRELRAMRERPVHTRAIDVMATDVAEAAHLASKSDLDEMWFHVRTYGGRLEQARETRREFHEERLRWERERQAGTATEASRLMYAYYVAEERYQSQVMAKYQHLLPLSLITSDDEDDELERVERARRRMVGMEGLLMDDKVLAMGADELERYGRERYHVRGGRELAIAPAVFAMQVRAAREQFEEVCEECAFRLAEQGRSLVAPETGPIQVVRRPLFRFDEVRGVDLHRLSRDFGRDVPVGETALSQFREAAHERASTLVDCIRYLDASGRRDVIDRLPVREVIGMERLAERLAQDPVLPSARTDVALTIPRRTVRTEPEIAGHVSAAVIDTLARERDGVRLDIEGLDL